MPGRRRSSSRRRLHFGECNPACTMQQEMNGMCFMCMMMSALLPRLCATCQAFTIGDDGTYDFGSATAPTGQMYGPGGELLDLTP